MNGTLIEMSRNDDYTTGNLLDFSSNQNYYKRIGIDLTRQTNTSTPQKINSCRNIRRVSWCNNVFYCWKATKAILNLSLDSLIVKE